MKGFEFDWRDAYPGINAATLMELKKNVDPRQVKIVPIVHYAIDRRIANGKPDYWDFATLLELAVLERDQKLIAETLPKVLASIREKWEPKTTARNLQLICDSRKTKGEDILWIEKVIKELLEWKS